MEIEMEIEIAIEEKKFFPIQSQPPEGIRSMLPNRLCIKRAPTFCDKCRQNVRGNDKKSVSVMNVKNIKKGQEK